MKMNFKYHSTRLFKLFNRFYLSHLINIFLIISFTLSFSILSNGETITESPTYFSTDINDNFTNDIKIQNKNFCSNKNALSEFSKFSNSNKGKASLINQIQKANYILVLKSKRTMFLINDNQVIKKYRIALGANPIGKKEKEGDQKTPEGFYHIRLKDDKYTHYFRALEISYPTPEQKAAALSKKESAGGLIRIHGLSQDPEKHSILSGELAESINDKFDENDSEDFKEMTLNMKKYFESKRHPIYDWTDGCIAVTDQEVSEIYDMVDLLTPIEICP